MSDGDAQEAERRASYQTLVRLANSCARAAARGEAVSPLAADLNQEDYNDIADILRKLAETIGPDLQGQR